MKVFWLCFVPLFVAVDAIGVLPMYIGLTEGLGKRPLRRVLVQSVLTASIVGLLFLFVGQATFKMLGVRVADFMVAGGVLLFVIAMSDLMHKTKIQREVDPGTLGAVPIGVPLICGPAVLTTIVVLAEEYGQFPTVLATILNIFLAGAIFSVSELFTRILGKAGMRTVSKIANLILAAIAVKIIRNGLVGYGLL